MQTPPSRAQLEYELRIRARKELDRRAELKSAAEGKLKEFIKQAWRLVEPGQNFVPGWHLDAISDHLEAVTMGQIRFLVINIPPRCMKSLTLSVFWPCWEWTRKPETRWLCSSYSSDLSVRDSVRCRRLIQSSWYQRNWGSLVKLTGDQNAKERFENDRTGYRIATSVDGLGTGEGGDRIVVDDPISAKDGDSETIRKSTNRWWDDTMSTRGNDPKRAAYVIVMQRLHEEDLSGHVLKQGVYEHLKLPMEYEKTTKVTSIGFHDPRTKEGELLWPQRIDEAEMERFRHTMSAYALAGQFQQRPAPAEGGIFKREWFRYYTKSELPPLSEMTLVQSWDMAFKETKDSDFVCGFLIARHHANFYLLVRDKRRLDFPGTVNAVRAMSAMWPMAWGKYIEDKANGPAVVSQLKKEIPGVQEVNPDGGKVSRANAVSPVVSAGNVFLPTEADWLEDFLLEITAFPNATYDDQVDAFTQGLNKLLKGGGGILAWYTARATAFQRSTAPPSATDGVPAPAIAPVYGHTPAPKVDEAAVGKEVWIN